MKVRKSVLKWLLRFAIFGVSTHVSFGQQDTDQVTAQPLNLSVGQSNSHDWGIRKETLVFIGQNLAEKYHLEFGSRRIPRAFHARTSFRL